MRSQAAHGTGWRHARKRTRASCWACWHPRRGGRRGPRMRRFRRRRPQAPARAPDPSGRRGPRMKPRAACAREPAAQGPAGGGRPKAQSTKRRPGLRPATRRTPGGAPALRRTPARRRRALLPRVGASSGLQGPRGGRPARAAERQAQPAHAAVGHEPQAVVRPQWALHKWPARPRPKVSGAAACCCGLRKSEGRVRGVRAPSNSRLLIYDARSVISHPIVTNG